MFNNINSNTSKGNEDRKLTAFKSNNSNITKTSTTNSEDTGLTNTHSFHRPFGNNTGKFANDPVPPLNKPVEPVFHNDLNHKKSSEYNATTKAPTSHVTNEVPKQQQQQPKHTKHKKKLGGFNLKKIGSSTTSLLLGNTNILHSLDTINNNYNINDNNIPTTITTTANNNNNNNNNDAISSGERKIKSNYKFGKHSNPTTSKNTATVNNNNYASDNEIDDSQSVYSNLSNSGNSIRRKMSSLVGGHVAHNHDNDDRISSRHHSTATSTVSNGNNYNNPISTHNSNSHGSSDHTAPTDRKKSGLAPLTKTHSFFGLFSHNDHHNNNDNDKSYITSTNTNKDNKKNVLKQRSQRQQQQIGNTAVNTSHHNATKKPSITNNSASKTHDGPLHSKNKAENVIMPVKSNLIKRTDTLRKPSRNISTKNITDTISPPSVSSSNMQNNNISNKNSDTLSLPEHDKGRNENDNKILDRQMPNATSAANDNTTGSILSYDSYNIDNKINSNNRTSTLFEGPTPLMKNVSATSRRNSDLSLKGIDNTITNIDEASSIVSHPTLQKAKTNWQAPQSWDIYNPEEEEGGITLNRKHIRKIPKHTNSSQDNSNDDVNKVSDNNNPNSSVKSTVIADKSSDNKGLDNLNIKKVSTDTVNPSSASPYIDNGHQNDKHQHQHHHHHHHHHHNNNDNTTENNDHIATKKEENLGGATNTVIINDNEDRIIPDKNIYEKFEDLSPFSSACPQDINPVNHKDNHHENTGPSPKNTTKNRDIELEEPLQKFHKIYTKPSTDYNNNRDNYSESDYYYNEDDICSDEDEIITRPLYSTSSKDSFLSTNADKLQDISSVYTTPNHTTINDKNTDVGTSSNSITNSVAANISSTLNLSKIHSNATKNMSTVNKGNPIFLVDKDEEIECFNYEKYYNDFSEVNLSRKFAIRIFNLSDGTFATLSAFLTSSVQELIPILKKKFNVSSSGVYQISLRIGKLSKVLRPHSKPISIQLRLLLLSGYKKFSDPLNILGVEDLSFVFQFLFHPLLTSQLTYEQESQLLRKGDFVHADLRDMDLTRPPIIFYQQASEIESLDASNNGNIFLPLDFIDTAINLSSLRMVNIRASKFPSNITEANKLVTLELCRNFIKKLPPNISQLENLTILNLQSNKLDRLPAGFAQLQHLQLLDLSSNRFTFYPEVINKCLNLLQIDLSYNKIQTIPKSINNLKKVAKMNISNNYLKVIDDFSGMDNLRTLNARYNKITAIKCNSPSLQNLYLTGNRISQFIDFLPNLRTLELQKNPLTVLRCHVDDIPLNLTTLCLNKANLSSVPSLIWQRFKSLKKLELNENNLTYLPDELSTLSKLLYLSANRNKLENIPESLTRLKNLKSLDLHSNNISELCKGFPNLELTTLNLSSNMLHSWQSNLTGLINDFVTNGGVSRSPLAKSLMFLSLADNRLNNSAWSWLNIFCNLKSLNLSYNQLSELNTSTLCNLTELYLSGNMLTTLSSDTISNALRNLKVLMVNNNKLLTLPAEISKLQQLSVFDVGDNQLKYNVSNYKYDWNWINNKELKYLNFSGNKRFEINSTVINGYDYSDLTNLRQLRVLGLMDVTLKTSKVPDEQFNLRLRTTESTINGMPYGVADTIGTRDYVTSRDVTFERFRGKPDEALICLYDGKNEIPNSNNKIPKVIRDIYDKLLIRMLEKYGDKEDSSIKKALRHSFLQLNKEINVLVHNNESLKSKDGNEVATGINNNTRLSAKDNMYADAEDSTLTVTDLSSGSTATVVYIKGGVIYTAGIGDSMAILTKNNGDHLVLTNEHVPNNEIEYNRLRISGGYVNNNKVDGVSEVSRAVGFFHLLPHIHASPDVSKVKITQSDKMLIIATKKLWKFIDYETACDIARANKLQPMLAAAKMKDYAISYGCTDIITVICLTLDKDHGGSNLSQFSLNRDDLINARFNSFEDTSLRRLQPEIQPPTGNVAIVFTDIKNSTALWESFPYAMRSAIKTHNSIMRRQLRIFGGYEVKTEGDAFMVAFPTPISALVWCLSVQLKLLEAAWPEEITSTQDGCEITNHIGHRIYYGLSVRMGIHWGRPVPEMDVVTQRMDYLGPVVNKAARVSGIADGGEITLSSDFVVEFQKIMKLHGKFVLSDQGNKESTMKEVYGDEFVGEVMEKEIQMLDDIGWEFRELGEQKLKGLESKEFITLVYPKILVDRFNFGSVENASSFFAKKTLFSFRQVTMRLENIITAINGCTADLQDKDQTSLIKFPESVQKSIFKQEEEADMIIFFDHLVTRLEALVVTLSLRQKVEGELKNNANRNQENKSVYELLDTLCEMAKANRKGQRE
ncbi:adenylate cyclase SCDLUD_004456 [Saccharomycodes ludwigii]|uniref:adenylate cyclase n=1 Tax=Saccharomycodes ludwigii TaxID=36035 RepID=UPI001E8BF81E|nr:hypothetical protein SCDLUD_004456 [Saccharomycodes ludwigii]KAH3899034.1 hypothetical protein SCDLUD_004456 [Saccharomycodes ludwigii]